MITFTDKVSNKLKNNSKEQFEVKPPLTYLHSFLNYTIVFNDDAVKSFYCFVFFDETKINIVDVNASIHAEFKKAVKLENLTLTLEDYEDPKQSPLDQELHVQVNTGGCTFTSSILINSINKHHWRYDDLAIGGNVFKDKHQL